MNNPRFLFKNTFIYHSENCFDYLASFSVLLQFLPQSFFFLMNEDQKLNNYLCILYFSFIPIRKLIFWIIKTKRGKLFLRKQKRRKLKCKHLYKEICINNCNAAEDIYIYIYIYILDLVNPRRWEKISGKRKFDTLDTGCSLPLST